MRPSDRRAESDLTDRERHAPGRGSGASHEIRLNGETAVHDLRGLTLARNYSNSQSLTPAPNVSTLQQLTRDFAAFALLIAITFGTVNNLSAATVQTFRPPGPRFTGFDGSILHPSGDPVFFPTTENEITLTGTNGTAQFTVEGTLDPGSVGPGISPLVRWRFASLPSTTLTWSPSWPGLATAGKGPNPTASLSGYLANNAQFGPRTVFMEVLRANTVLLTKFTQVEVFFARDATATGRTVPNWFHYWNQTPANIVANQYEPNQGPDGVYVNGETLVRIGPGARLQDAPSLVPGGEGIDNFGSTLLHERAHMDYWITTWGQGVTTSPVEDDFDRDGLRDLDEANLTALNGDPYDGESFDTDGDGFGDFEDFASIAESQWLSGSADIHDWAQPGHQHRVRM